MPRLRKFVVGLFLMLAPLLLALAILFGITPQLNSETAMRDWYFGVLYACLAIIGAYIMLGIFGLFWGISKFILGGCEMMRSAWQGTVQQETTEEAVGRNS